VRVLDLAAMSIKLAASRTGRRSRLVFHPLPSDDPLQRRPDISRARELLGWEPHTALAIGLERTADYFARAALPSREPAVELAG
jgi:UDP-glucuronate decarboxylase